MTTEGAIDEGYLFSQVTYHCITPLHVGVGQDVGVVDLPVAREVTTGYPFVPGSGIRGSLRDRAEARSTPGGTSPSSPALPEPGPSAARRRPRSEVDRLFGPWEGELTAGCVSVLDARLLLFPVRSSAGVFRWLTCPFVLQRYRRDQAYFLGAAAGPELPEIKLGEDSYAGTGGSPLYLEEFPFQRAGDWKWQEPPGGADADRIVLVDDEVFGYFVRNATVVQQRNRLSTAKTVLRGALFSIEAVPPETIFYGFLAAHRERSEELDRWSQEEVASRLRSIACDLEAHDHGHLVLGGGESVGLGVTRLNWEGGAP